MRYKLPNGESSHRLVEFVPARQADAAEVSADLRFASAVAAFGLVVKRSRHKGLATYDMARDLARRGLGSDESGDRHEFLRLVDRAEDLDPRATRPADLSPR